MKVLEVNTLHKGIDDSQKQLAIHLEQIKQVEADVVGLSSLEDSFRGEGGEAIRSFFRECHQPFLLFYQQFLANYQETLFQMKSTLVSLEPAQNGFIRESFLEGELEQGIAQSAAITEELAEEANSSMDAVQDIVSLPRIQSVYFLQGVTEAKKNRDQMVEQLYAFDQQQTAAFGLIEQDLQKLNQYITQIRSMFQRGDIGITGYQSGSLPHLQLASLAIGEGQMREGEMPVNSCPRPAETEEKEAGGWEDVLLGGLSFGLDLIPIISNIKAGIESSTGKDLISQRELSGMERTIIAASVLGGPITKLGSKVVKGLWGLGSKAVSAIPKYTDAVAAQFARLKHVIHPDKIKSAFDYAYNQVKQPIHRADRQLKNLAKNILDTPMALGPQLAGGFGTASRTVREVAEEGKDQIVYFAKKVEVHTAKAIDRTKRAASAFVESVEDKVIGRVKEEKKDAGKGIDKTRPSWRQSEIDIGKEYPGYRDQVSFKDRNEVSHGTKNSSRPDFYINGHSIEVKNYKVTTSSGRSNLIRNVSNQINKRISDLPEQTKQSVIIDVRGQNVTRDVLRDIKQKINGRTNGVAEIIFKMD